MGVGVQQHVTDYRLFIPALSWTEWNFFPVKNPRKKSKAFALLNTCGSFLRFFFLPRQMELKNCENGSIYANANLPEPTLIDNQTPVSMKPGEMDHKINVTAKWWQCRSSRQMVFPVLVYIFLLMCPRSNDDDGMCKLLFDLNLIGGLIEFQTYCAERCKERRIQID